MPSKTMRVTQVKRPPRIEIHVAPPKYAERRHARPGAGIKRARGVMLPRPRRALASAAANASAPILARGTSARAGRRPARGASP